MRLPRQFIQAVFLVFLLPVAGLASWHDHQQGSPALDFFPNRIIGATPQTSMIVQDSRGRLFVGSDALLVYDGANWSSHPLPDSYNLMALCFGPEQKLWAGAHNQIGYYTEQSSGAFVFTSLIAQLPAEHRRIEYTWGCGLVGPVVYFICDAKVLRWDGHQFTVWDFPNESRLYPVWLGQELWFTHLETGLYRLTAEGPRLEYGPKDLPPNPAFGMERDSGGLRLFSRDGLCYAGRPRQQLCAPEVIDFLRTRPLSNVQRLPNGNFALGTLGGLGIMSAEGRLLRTLNQEDGLTSNSINTLFLDQENQLWVGHATGGLARLDPTGAVSLFQHWGQSDHASLFRLTEANGLVLAATDAGLFRLEATDASHGKFLPLESMPAHVVDALAFDQGVLLGRFGGLDHFDGQKIRPALIAPSLSCWRTLPSRKEPGVFFALLGQKIARITHEPAEQWQRQDLGELLENANNCYLDPQDNLWLNSAQSGIWHFATATRQLTNIHPGKNPRHLTEASQVTGFGPKVYFFTTREGYTAEIATKQTEPIAGYPAVTALQCVVSPDGRRLYVVFERKLTARSTYGLGRFKLDEHGTPGDWTELHVPKLETAGVPSTLLVTTEDGGDALWAGGSEGLLRIKPAELSPVLAPVRPWLRAGESSGPAGLVPAYPFFGHHLSIQTGTAEIDTRPHLLFQTRLGDGAGEWSQATLRSSFEFTNLTDGTYRFEVRAVNEAGLVSAPVAYTFRILPPWFRTPWAYAGVAAAAAATVFGYIRRRERRIRARNEQLETLVVKRTSELVKANAAKDEFLAGISHEIRNPMNGVIGLANLIDHAAFDPTTQHHLTQLRHCATHLSGLLEDILDYSRLQAGAIELNPQTFDLHELTDALTALTSAESAESGIPLEIAVSPTVPRYLVGDAARLRQILLNYLVNALKYSGRGTVCLTIWGQQNLPDQIALTFAVSDDGPGIAPAEQIRLFHRFERGAAAHNRRVAGTGLGLALCKTLGEKMGGRLWVESEPGQGSTFYLALTLPVAAGATERRRPEKSPAPAADALHALVVDDEDYNRLALAGLLGELGFQVRTAASGDEALRLAREQPLHAVFLDLNLPGMCGEEIARALRALGTLEPSLPIIATTAYASAENRQQGSLAGLSAFLIKPVSLEKIRTALTAATAAQRPSASFHAPVPDQNIDPFGNLRLLAQRKGVALETEIALFFTELASEERVLAAALANRDITAAGDAAHRLVGRLAFIHASVETQLARDIEASSTNEFWDQAHESTSRLASLVAALRAQTMTAGSADPAGSARSQSRNESA